MGVVWGWEASVGAVTGPICSLIGLAVYLARPQAFQNRILAFVLFLEGAIMTTGGGWVHMLDDPGAVYALEAITIVCAMAALPGYLVFLGTLEGPVARFLRLRPLRIAFYTGMVVGPLSWFLFPRFYLGPDVIEGTYGPLDLQYATGFHMMALLWMVIAGTGLATVITQWRALPDNEKPRGRRMTTAFIWRDVIVFGSAPLFVLGPVEWQGIFGVFLPSVMLIGFVLLLSYAVLRDQVLGIEITVKRSVARGLVVAPFVVLFFVAAETLEGFVPFESYWVGLAAAGALTLAFTPLHRAAWRTADRLMPGVEDTPEYLGRRAHEIYEAALTAAAGDGEVTDKERLVLQKLREQLGIDGTSQTSG